MTGWVKHPGPDRDLVVYESGTARVRATIGSEVLALSLEPGSSLDERGLSLVYIGDGPWRLQVLGDWRPGRSPDAYGYVALENEADDVVIQAFGDEGRCTVLAYSESGSTVAGTISCSGLEVYGSTGLAAEQPDPLVTLEIEYRAEVAGGR
jgi:hypothetical protein